MTAKRYDLEQLLQSARYWGSEAAANLNTWEKSDAKGDLAHEAGFDVDGWARIPLADRMLLMEAFQQGWSAELEALDIL